MEFSIQMLGTGFAFSKIYDNTNALIRCNGYTLLIDCGYTATRSLHELTIKLNQLDGIFITHLHADHIGGLEEIAFQLKYVYGKKLNLYLPSTLRDPLWENCLKGGLENKQANMDSLEAYFNVIEIDQGIRTEVFPQFWLETFPTKHIPGKASYALLINDVLYYSADACFDEPLLHHLYYQRNCQTIFHDCQLYLPQTVHTTLYDLLSLPEEIQSITYLMHYGDNMKEFSGMTGKMKFVNRHEIYRFPIQP